MLALPAQPILSEPSRPACLRVILAMIDLRPTRQRLLIAERIIGHQRHFTASDLYAEYAGSPQLPSLGTIYNTLNQFEEKGLVRALMCSGIQTVYDSNTRSHHHYLLEETGEVVDVSDATIHIARYPQPPRGFTLDRIEVTIRLRRARADQMPDQLETQPSHNATGTARETAERT